MIKNIIFDMGNVIFNYDRDFLLKHFYDGKDYELLKEQAFKNWELLDTDKLSLEEYNEIVKKSLPPHLSHYALSALNHWEYFMIFNREVFSIIKELKEKNFNLYILSNITKHFTKNAYKFPILKEFDGIVYSAEIKMQKPDDDAYLYLLDKFNLKATECVFIDDTKKNLATAARFGMKTFHYQSNAKDLKDFLFSL